MTQIDFSKLSDKALIDASFDEQLGFTRARVITELAVRALTNPNLMDSACKAISSDRSIGFHKGAPLGWFGADELYLSGQEHAIRTLLHEMDNWEPTEQEDLVRHWAGKRGLISLTRELQELYGWIPRYQLQT